MLCLLRTMTMRRLELLADFLRDKLTIVQWMSIIILASTWFSLVHFESRIREKNIIEFDQNNNWKNESFGPARRVEQTDWQKRNTNVCEISFGFFVGYFSGLLCLFHTRSTKLNRWIWLKNEFEFIGMDFVRRQTLRFTVVMSIAIGRRWLYMLREMSSTANNQR